jgi:hypothetical protein
MTLDIRSFAQQGLRRVFGKVHLADTFSAMEQDCVRQPFTHLLPALPVCALPRVEGCMHDR